MTIPNIWKNKTCSKPPTRNCSLMLLKDHPKRCCSTSEGVWSWQSQRLPISAAHHPKKKANGIDEISKHPSWPTTLFHGQSIDNLDMYCWYIDMYCWSFNLWIFSMNISSCLAQIPSPNRCHRRWHLKLNSFWKAPDPGRSIQWFSAWWYTYPSEKYEFVNWDDYSQYMGTYKMFQTTNQLFSIWNPETSPQKTSSTSIHWLIMAL